MSEGQDTSEKDRGVAIRAGLSEMDRGLPVRQNIIRVYNHTPELQSLGSAYQSRDKEQMQSSFTQAALDIEQYYGLTLQVLPDSDLERETSSPDNKATLRGETIIMAQSTRANPKQALIELSHELGAHRLIEIYGSKENLPRGLPAIEPGGPLLFATQYLDELVLSGGTMMDHVNALGNLILENSRKK